MIGQRWSSWSGSTTAFSPVLGSVLMWNCWPNRPNLPRGVIAREVARREPDAVRRVITYGIPPSVEHVEVSSTHIGMGVHRTLGRSWLSVWPVV